MKHRIGLVTLAAVALGGLLILALPGWMMYGGMMSGFSGASRGLWLSWATEFILLAGLVIGAGAVVLSKIK